MGEGWFVRRKSNSSPRPYCRLATRPTAPRDLLVLDPSAARRNSSRSHCVARRAKAATQCLSEAQIAAIKTLHSTYKFSFALENGLDDYPGWGVSGENTPAFGPTGGWISWWLGKAAPAQPPVPANGIAWIYGAGGIDVSSRATPSSMSRPTSLTSTRSACFRCRD